MASLTSWPTCTRISNGFPSLLAYKAWVERPITGQGRFGKVNCRGAFVDEDANLEIDLYQALAVKIDDLCKSMGNDAGNIQRAAFLNAPLRQFTSTGRHVLIKMKFWFENVRAFMIGDGKLLTNSHCVEHGTQVIEEPEKMVKKFQALEVTIEVKADNFDD
ncbi:hypothetical protein QJS10_CPA06g01886 [Acorus calamus]|uniref:Uncharacterized protein n=1 Tax=Acorus calamus TaxID=4465 RepID=A0AAV9EJ45_ACOCL|nr:hypothetical protein QJS10_CPA06g01886 [Acorus calamus]